MPRYEMSITAQVTIDAKDLDTAYEILDMIPFGDMMNYTVVPKEVGE